MVNARILLLRPMRSGLRAIVLVLIFIASTLSLSPLRAVETLRMGGSDLLYEVIHDSVLAFSQEGGLAIDLRLEGSHLATRGLRDGELDLALLAIPRDRAPAIEGVEALPVGYLVAVVVVNVANPIESISLGKLAAMFADTGGPEVPQWGDVGLSGTWAGRRINLHIIDSSVSIAHELFRHMVLRDRSFRSTVSHWNDPDQMLGALVEDIGALAVTRSPEPHPRTKVVPVSANDQDFAFGPTMENIYFADYPMRLPFHIVYRMDRAGFLLPLIKYLLSEEMAANFIAANMVPLPEQLRMQMSAELDLSLGASR